MCGIGYVVDNYIAFFTNYQKELQYKNYVADALKYLTENTSKHYGGIYMTTRLADVLEPHVETRTSEEIITDISNKLRGMSE